jgi:hypothetical protein
VRDDCFAGEQLQSIEDARRRSRHWSLEEYGMRRHSTTRRIPREHFEAEEKAQLLPAPTERYDVPRWSEPKIARDQHAQVASALYSLPTAFIGKKLRARQDRSTVRFYDKGVIVKTHARVLPGRRSTDQRSACLVMATFRRDPSSKGELPPDRQRPGHLLA